jgi:hypothetical protein
MRFRETPSVRFDAIHPGRTVTVDELDAYCREHELVLPSALRSQLLDQNGGAPMAEVLVPLPGGGATDVFSLFGLMMGDKSSELAWVAATLSGRIPDGLVPFANDSFGNLFLVDRDNGVWFWDHEREGSPDAATSMDESLDRFLQALAT